MLTTALHRHLLARERAGDPLRIAVVGAGFLGRSVVRQCERTPGLAVAAIADRNLDEARAALSPAQQDATTVCAEPMQIVDVPADAIVDCTGDPAFGATIALAAIARRRPFFGNAEADATVGPALARRARQAGALYSGCGGDEHAEAYALVCHARLLGFEVVAAGKFKGFLDPAATPRSVQPFAARHAQSPHSLCSFADGTKMSLEMAILGNATGLAPDVRGMHCPRVDRGAVASTLTNAPGGVLGRAGAVDVVVGAEPSSSVFVVVRANDRQLERDLAYLKLGDGPDYLLTKPFHLCGAELAPAVAAALVDNEPTIAPAGAPVAAVFAVAKRDLAAGGRLDRIGGTTHRGVIDRAATVHADDLLPIGLARGARLRRAVRSGAPITFADVELADHGPLRDLLDEQSGRGHDGPPDPP